MVSVWLCKRRIALFLSLLLAFFQAAAICAEPPAEPAGDNRPANSASGGDMVFSAQKWSIVPVGAARESAKTARFAGNKFVPLSEPGKITSAAPFRQTEVLPGAAASAAPAATKTLKLYGRIEELCAVRGAKIPLKMRAMTPIRDSSLDAKIAVNNTRLPGHATMLGYLPLPKTQAQSPSQLFIGAQQNEPSILPPVPQAAYPPDYQGIWSGEMTVYMVDYDRSYFEFDRAEAEKQQQLVKY